MLERLAYRDMQDWHDRKTRQGLLVTGARQVGKTTLVRAFAHGAYEHVAEVNFLEDPDAVGLVSQVRDAADLLLRISVLAKGDLVPGSTLIFLDEVQEFEDILTWLKFLKDATDYDFVLSGSLLGVDLRNVRSFPVGFVQELQMFPLTFFEFCRAAGMPQAALDRVGECFGAVEPVPDFIHERLIDLFYKYLLVGGMPDAVNAFVETSDMARVRNSQRAVYAAYERDITKYVPDPVDRRHIKSIYEAIPNQLNSQNKRFKFTRLGENARFAHMQTAFDRLERAGIALPTLRVSGPVYPLGGSADISSFKLFMNDVGLLTSRLMGNVDVEILSRRSSVNYGSIFENAVAQELRAQGFELFYYNSSAVGEVDFLVQDRMGGVSLVEVKSGKDYKRHRAMNGLLGTKNYGLPMPMCSTTATSSQTAGWTTCPSTWSAVCGGEPRASRAAARLPPHGSARLGGPGVSAQFFAKCAFMGVRSGGAEFATWGFAGVPAPAASPPCGTCELPFGTPGGVPFSVRAPQPNFLRGFAGLGHRSAKWGARGAPASRVGVACVVPRGLPVGMCIFAAARRSPPSFALDFPPTSQSVKSAGK